jgi:uncharacterized protein YecE (DUF72 family)
MAKILVGTCGYFYKDWVGPVYPKGTKQADYLRLYAGRFSTVELDFAYYAMPEAAQLANMLAVGGPNLTFSIKAHKTLTHKIDPAQWEGQAWAYREAIDPLLQAKRLEKVLFQFPPEFGYTQDNRRYLDALLTWFKDVPSAVEFRLADWYTNRVIEGMKKREVSLAAVDVPDIRGLPPAIDVVTASTAYIRLHGRNKETWWGSDGPARYDYLYNDKELESWGDRLQRIVLQADRILVYFNNHRRGQAVENAQTLIQILDKTGLSGDLVQVKGIKHGFDSTGDLPF